MACSFTAGVVIRQFCPESCAVCGTASQPDDQRNGANEEPAPIIEQGQANQAFAVAVGICVALALVAVAAAIARAAAKNKADLSIYTVGGTTKSAKEAGPHSGHVLVAHASVVYNIPFADHADTGDIALMNQIRDWGSNTGQSKSNANSAPAGSSRPKKNRKDDYLGIGESTADTAANVDTTRYLHTPSIIPHPYLVRAMTASQQHRARQQFLHDAFVGFRTVTGLVARPGLFYTLLMLFIAYWPVQSCVSTNNITCLLEVDQTFTSPHWYCRPYLYTRARTVQACAYTDTTLYHRVLDHAGLSPCDCHSARPDVIRDGMYHLTTESRASAAASVDGRASPSVTISTWTQHTTC